MKTHMVGIIVLVLASLCPFSIWINISLISAIDKMQSHIDWRDSFINTTTYKYYNSLDSIDSLKFEQYKAKFQ